LIDRKPKSSPDDIRKYIKNVSTSGGKLQAVVQATYSTSDSGQKQNKNNSKSQIAQKPLYAIT